MVTDEPNNQLVILNPMIINTITTSSSAVVPPLAMSLKLLYVNIRMNDQPSQAMITGASNIFVVEPTVAHLGLRLSSARDRVKTINTSERRIRDISYDVLIELGIWRGCHHVCVVQLDDFEAILGMDFLRWASVVVIPYLHGL